MYKRILIGLGLALVGVEYTRFSRLIDSVSFKTKNVKLNMVQGKIVVVFQIEITNNSSKDIEVQNINGKLFVGDKFLANYFTTQTQTIGAGQKSILPITAMLSNNDLAKTIQTLNLNTTEITLKTKAKIGFKALGLFEFPVNIKDETTVATGNIVKELNTYLKKWIDLFKK